MQDRIKRIRKALRLTQAEFGARIGVKGNTVTGYETGIRSPSEAVITSICREFNVSESWLRAGSEPMFLPVSRDTEIASFVGSALRGDDDNFQRRFLSMLSKLDADEWEVLERMVQKIKED